MNKHLFLVFIFIASLMSSFSLFAKNSSVEVTNFPIIQDVNVTNLPAVQDVTVTNQPAVQDVDIVDNRQHITVRYVNQAGLATALITFSSNLNLFFFQGIIPEGKKAVLTDFALVHAVNTSEGISSANFVTSTVPGECSQGRELIQLRVPQGPSYIANFISGIEIYEGESLCISIGGPNLTLKIFGYLTDM